MHSYCLKFINCNCSYNQTDPKTQSEKWFRQNFLLVLTTSARTLTVSIDSWYSFFNTGTASFNSPAHLSFLEAE